MGKYLLFVGKEYYPKGWVHEPAGSSDSIIDLQDIAIDVRAQWAHIALAETLEIVTIGVFEDNDGPSHTIMWMTPQEYKDYQDC